MSSCAKIPEVPIRQFLRHAPISTTDLPKFLADPKVSIFLFRDNGGTYHIVRKNQATLNFPHEVVRNLIETMVSKDQIFSQTTSLEPNPPLFGIREADRSISLLDTLPSLKTFYVVENGGMMLTCSKTQFKATITLKFNDSYLKFRDISVYPRPEGLKNYQNHFEAWRWIAISLGTPALLLDRMGIEESTEYKRQSQENQLKIREAFHSLSYITHMSPNGISHDSRQDTPQAIENKERELLNLKSQGYKITTIMSPEHNLLVVASMRIKEGAVKVIKVAHILWAHQEQWMDELGDPIVLAKGKPMIANSGELCRDNAGAIQYWAENLLSEAAISHELAQAHVPYTLRIYAHPRRNPQKAGLVMEYCDASLLEYLNTVRFKSPDTLSSTLLPNEKSLFLQTIQALIGLQQLGYVHRDLHFGNILCKRTSSGFEARLSDFELARKLPAREDCHYNLVFSPPEFLKERELQLLSHQDPPLAALSLKIDPWGFGVMLAFLVCPTRGLVNKMRVRDDELHGAEIVTQVASEIIATLTPGILLHDAIRGLLDPNPETRMSFEQIKILLEK